MLLYRYELLSHSYDIRKRKKIYLETHNLRIMQGIMNLTLYADLISVSNYENHLWLYYVRVI